MLGDDDLRALDELYARVVWIPDGELDRLDEAAREYREIVGAPDPPPDAGDNDGATGDGGEAGGPAGDGDPSGREGGADVGQGAGSLADAIEQAITSARTSQIEQLDEDVDLDKILRDAASRGEEATKLGRGRGTGLPSGRVPDRGVDRPPFPDEVRTPAATPTGCARRSRGRRGRSTSEPRAGASTAAPTHAAAPSRQPADR